MNKQKAMDIYVCFYSATRKVCSAVCVGPDVLYVLNGDEIFVIYTGICLI